MGTFPISPQLQVKVFSPKPGCGCSQGGEDEGDGDGGVGASCCQHRILGCPLRFFFFRAYFAK